MFEGFLHTLRASGVPVATDEWLVLQGALGRGLADDRLDGFYLLARSLLVKSERHYDGYDLAFSTYFGDVEATSPEISDRVLDWLRDDANVLRLDADQRARLDAMLEHLDLDELRERLEERLRNQDGAHHGGSRHIGTGGTSPFGHSGYHPGGVRIGGPSRNRSAVQVAAERRFRDYRADAELGVRQFGVALRRLRELSDRIDGPRSELDLDGTIRATADQGGRLRLAFRRPRRNSVRVLLLVDVGGSMDDHAELVTRLFSAVHQASHFRSLTVRYFHNCVYDRLYHSAELHPARSEATSSILAQLEPDHRLVVVGDGCMAPSELVMEGGALDYYQRNDEPGWVWLDRLRRRYERSVWINPVPEAWWPAIHGARTIAAVRTIFPMFELSVEGLEASVRTLMGRRAPG